MAIVPIKLQILRERTDSYLELNPIFVHTVILKVSVTDAVLPLCVIGSEILQQTNGKFMIDSIVDMEDFNKQESIPVGSVPPAYPPYVASHLMSALVGVGSCIVRSSSEQV